MSALWFASPGLAAAAAAAVTLPVAIHLLLRRRRKPIEWAAMELLREAMRRVERRRRIERWLLLAVRCLVVACAGMAIAAPFIGGETSASRVPTTLAVVIDDSAASNERVAGGTAFDRSVKAAKAAVESLAGRIYSRKIAKAELAQYEAEFKVISNKMVAGRPLIHVYSDEPLDGEFAPAQPSLEDVFFAKIGGLN